MNTKVDEGKLISGREALIALANGEDVLWRTKTDAEIKCFKGQTPDLEIVLSGNCDYRFWVKPRTITLNGIEVPAPFEPKEGDKYYYIDSNRKICYDWDNNDCETTDENRVAFGAWRTEEEIKQVIAALRQVFGGSHDN